MLLLLLMIAAAGPLENIELRFRCPCRRREREAEGTEQDWTGPEWTECHPDSSRDKITTGLNYDH